MGDGYGPMLVVNQGTEFPTDKAALVEWLRGKTIAVPGLMTSAYLSLQLYMGAVTYVVVPFDEIFTAVKSGRADVGLIIHEGQLTYRTEGFEKVLDLGEWWKAETGLPLPLGGNVIRKDFTPAERSELNVILRESIRYGLEHRAAGVTHSMPLARGMDEPLADEFIGMYVNDFTLDYGDVGRRAIREFLGRAHKAGLIPTPVELEFVE
jgi:1,4-dihydroxy-6-naphthoate synthase